MGIVVQKFGGILLESPAKIRRAAQYIVQTKLGGEDPVVVVSAPGKATDHLLRWAGKVSEHPEGRELDMLLSVGERMAIALLALAINAEGKYQAVSFTGSQVGIITDTRHTDASIVEVKGFRIREAISQNQIPIIAGFQGISTDKEITTLGRGGSDATAVALAAALGAERCELIKERGGIYSADPFQVSDPQLLPEIDYLTLENITQAGANVVQSRAAALAKEYKVVLSINAPDGQRGTLVVDRTFSKSSVSAVTLQFGTLRTGKDDRFPEDNLCSSSELFNWCDRGWFAVDLSSSGLGTPVGVVTILGWGGKLSSIAVDTCISTMLDVKLDTLGVFRSGGSVQFVVPFSSGKNAVELIHSSMLRTGLIERHDPEHVSQI